MTVKFKVFLSLLFLLLLAAPGSAWEQTFENHPDDLDSDSYSTTFPITTTGTTHYLYSVMDSTQSITFNVSWNGYLGFTIDPAQYGSFSAATANINVKMLDADGVQIFNSDMGIVNATDGAKRIELIGTTSGVSYYKNGVFVDSDAYLVSDSEENISQIILTMSRVSTTLYLKIDDFTTSYGVVGCDEEFDTLDSYQYYTAGFPFPSDAFWVTKVYAPNGSVIQTTNVSLGVEYSIPKSLIKESGTYFIRLYEHDNLTESEYFYASRSFFYESPSGSTITLDKDEYERSDQMQIFTNIPSSSFTSGYTVKIGYNTGDGTEYYTYSVPSSDYTKTYALSANAVGGFYSVHLYNPSDNIIASDEYYMSAPDGSTTVSLDKSTYETSDTIKISYTGASTGSTLYMYLRDSSSVLYSKTWSLSSASGVKSFDLSSYPGTTIVYVKIVKDSVLLADDRSTVFSGDYYLSGKIYDSVTKAAVEGAQISVNGSSTTTNEIGYYETPVNAGLQTVTILCDGYQQFTSNIYVSDLLSTQNFYIVPTSSTGSDTLYGVVVDYYTGSPVNSSYVQISNGSTTHSMLTNSKTGNYVFTQDGLAGTWTITVTKTNYDTYDGTVTISGDTYKQIRLVPTDGVDSEDSDSTDSTDRPSREAAEESLTWLEETIPGLVKLAVIVFMFALIGWRF